MADNQHNFVTFEMSTDGEQLFIFGDAAGLTRLRNTLEWLVFSSNDGHFDHTDLMAPALGGTDLSNEQQGNDARMLNHVTLYCI